MRNPVNRKEINDILYNVNVFDPTAHQTKRLRIDETSSFLGEIFCSFRSGLEYSILKIVGTISQFYFSAFNGRNQLFFCPKTPVIFFTFFIKRKGKYLSLLRTESCL